MTHQHCMCISSFSLVVSVKVSSSRKTCLEEKESLVGVGWFGFPALSKIWKYCRVSFSALTRLQTWEDARILGEW